MIQLEAISARKFAENSGVTINTVLRWCKAGKIIGARKHHLTRQWWIYPPAKLNLGWGKLPVKGGAL
jgi:hypothetical protein